MAALAGLRSRSLSLEHAGNRQASWPHAPDRTPRDQPQACTGQGTHGLSTDTRRAASDDRLSPGQVDARDDFRRRRLESKVGSEPCHCSDEDSSLRAPSG